MDRHREDAALVCRQERRWFEVGADTDDAVLVGRLGRW
jgi:hypothetical protein